MNVSLVRHPFGSALRACALICVATIALFTSTTKASAALVPVQGSATSSVTDLVFNDDGTISIVAEQSGHLTNFGDFTGTFSYLATPTSYGFLVTGTGTLIASNGDKLFLNLFILELGADYPFQVVGVLSVTGGTGRYRGAYGAIGISGYDQADLTDTFNLQGTIVTR
jgi:hypothetical protein